MRKLVLAGAAATAIALGSAQAAHFEPLYTFVGTGATVSVTDDGCTASVLFDEASVSEARDWYATPIPLMIDGRSTVNVDARGFYTGYADASATVSIEGRERTLYFEEGDDGNWSRTFALRRASGAFDLSMYLAGAYDQSMLVLDSVDLTLDDCGE